MQLAALIKGALGSVVEGLAAIGETDEAALERFWRDEASPCRPVDELPTEEGIR